MAKVDKQLTILADEVTVAQAMFQVNQDGSVSLFVTGHTKDDSDNKVGLSKAEGRVDMSDASVQAVMALALTALAQANDLDDSDPVITDHDPAKALAQAQKALAKAKKAAK